MFQSVRGVCFGIFSNTNPIVATYGYLQLPCIIFMFWIIHRSHPWHPEFLWLFNPNLFAQITSYLFTNFMNYCSFSFENNTGGHLVIGIWVIPPKGIKSHIPWLWATKHISLGQLNVLFPNKPAQTWMFETTWMKDLFSISHSLSSYIIDCAMDE